MATYADRVSSSDRINTVLARAMLHRKDRMNITIDPHCVYNGEVPEWVLYERNCVFNEVNAQRVLLKKKPIEMKLVVRAENSAKGHSDYQRKYALNAMELVFDED